MPHIGTIHCTAKALGLFCPSHGSPVSNVLKVTVLYLENQFSVVSSRSESL